GAPGKLLAVNLPLPKTTWPEVVWQQATPGTPSTMIAADDRLFVVTLDGHILCFANEPADPLIYPKEGGPRKNHQWSKKTETVMGATGVREGYCVCWGIGSGRLVTALARRSKLHIIVVEPDEAKVKEARDNLIGTRLHGDRVAVVHADPMKISLPPYFASLQ